MRALVLVVISLCACTKPTPRDVSAFRLVVVDTKSEAKLGPFPYDREVYARGVRAVLAAGAKGVVLKYFLDQAKTPAGDKALADAIAAAPVIVQASLQSDGTTREITAPSGLGNLATFHPRLSGDKAWLPLETFATAARGIGFVDVPDAKTPARIALVEAFNGKPQASLHLHALRLADPTVMIEGGALKSGAKQIALDDRGELALDASKLAVMESLSLCDVLDGSADKTLIAGRVVVLGYRGDKAPSFDTPAGRLGAHDLWYSELVALHGLLH